MDIKKLIKKLLLIPLVFIVILAIIAVSGLRSWNDMLIPIIGVLIGKLLSCCYIFTSLRFIRITKTRINKEMPTPSKPYILQTIPFSIFQGSHSV